MTPRFCCWCGKEETTELCQSESLKEAAAKVAGLMGLGKTPIKTVKE